MIRIPKALPFLIPIFFVGGSAWGETQSYNTSYENSPWLSARAAGLGEALSTSATALDAFYYNPALIGGVHEKGDKPFLTHLYIPYVGLSSADGGKDLLQERFSGTTLESDAFANKIRGAFGSERPYGRLSLTPVMLFNRLLVGYTFNSRLSALKDNTDPTASKLLLTERTTSGPLLGFSATAPKDEFYLGVSASFLKVDETNAAMTAAEFEDDATRKNLLRDGKDSFEGMPIHIGSAYRFKHAWKPAISAVVQDLGGTRYSRKDKTQSPRLQKENVLIGFSVSPMIQDWAMVNVTTEVANLTDSSVSFADKLRASTELTVGERFGADAGFSVRMGYTAAGMSYGVGTNFGIIHAEFALFAEDIGVKDSKVIERKSVFNIGINIADY